MDFARLRPLRFVAALSVAGCYDWTLGVAPDGGADGSKKLDAPGDAEIRDVVVEGATDVHIPQEAAPPEATTPPKDAPPDAPSCASLRAAIDQAKIAAKNCSTAPADACEARVSDQCACVVFVAQADSTATANYLAAIKALSAAGCPADCATCPVPPDGSLCLSGEVDGMLTDTCQP
jgi:hypothetical protein